MDCTRAADRHRLVSLRESLRARAAGWWRVEAGRLEQVAFEADDDMAPEVARAFREATRSVPLASTDLGIVRAVLTGKVVVSRIDELPAETGSGLWLRRFGAARSVAVPVEDQSSILRDVVSVALALEPADEHVAAAIRAACESSPRR
jgi:hypothetical protein